MHNLDNEKEQLLEGEIATRLHIKDVSQLLTNAAIELLDRSKRHDDSKLEEPEAYKFALAAARFKEPGNEYGTPGYEETKQWLGEALDHHYKNNSHHPEFYENGVADMNIFDILEMLIDWKAASFRRSADGMLDLSLNRTNHKIPDDLLQLLKNTADYLNWDYK